MLTKENYEKLKQLYSNKEYEAVLDYITENYSENELLSNVNLCLFYDLCIDRMLPEEGMRYHPEKTLYYLKSNNNISKYILFDFIGYKCIDYPKINEDIIKIVKEKLKEKLKIEKCSEKIKSIIENYVKE